jgi:hypothetical protein
VRPKSVSIVTVGDDATLSKTDVDLVESTIHEWHQ